MFFIEQLDAKYVLLLSEKLVNKLFLDESCWCLQADKWLSVANNRIVC